MPLCLLLLSPGKPVERRKLYWIIWFPGDGILDCIEIISHAVREGRCLQKPELHHPEAPMSLVWQFVFDIAYQKKTVRIWPNIDVFDDEFRNPVSTWQEQAPSKERKSIWIRNTRVEFQSNIKLLCMIETPFKPAPGINRVFCCKQDISSFITTYW